MRTAEAEFEQKSTALPSDNKPEIFAAEQDPLSRHLIHDVVIGIYCRRVCPNPLRQKRMDLDAKVGVMGGVLESRLTGSVNRN